MAANQYTIEVVTNDEDPDVGGFFAFFVWDPETRGHGSTQMSAILCLVLVTAENYQEDLSEQAGDIVINSSIQNTKLEEALGKHYGGTIKYV